MAKPHYGTHGRCEATARSTDERCKRPAVDDHGKCDMHGGRTPTGTDHGRYDHGAFSKQLTASLTETERAAFAEAREMLKTPEGAQDLAQTVAAMCLIKFSRTGHERFLRRFASVCDTFGLMPDDALTVRTKPIEQAMLDDIRSYHDAG